MNTIEKADKFLAELPHHHRGSARTRLIKELRDELVNVITQPIAIPIGSGHTQVAPIKCEGDMPGFEMKLGHTTVVVVFKNEAVRKQFIEHICSTTHTQEA